MVPGEQTEDLPASAHALSLEQLAELVANTSETEAAVRRLEACLKRPAALALSFRHGGTGPPDFAAVASAVSALAAPAQAAEHERAEAIMEALSSALSSARPRRRPKGDSATQGEIACRSPQEVAAQNAAVERRQEAERWGSWVQGWRSQERQQQEQQSQQQSQQQQQQLEDELQQELQQELQEEGLPVAMEDQQAAPEESAEVEEATEGEGEEELDGTSVSELSYVVAPDNIEPPDMDINEAINEEMDRMDTEGNGGVFDDSPEPMDSPPADASPNSLPLGEDDEVPGDTGLDCAWVLTAMAAALPLLEGALPKDERGECVLPHQHRMRMMQADVENMPVRFWGTRAVYVTDKICDRCMEVIVDRVFYHCCEDCDVDFCAQCHEDQQAVLDRFFAAGTDRAAPPEKMVERMLWSVHVADELAFRALFRPAGERRALAELLAFEWPVELFSRLVAAVANICNAKMLFNATKGAMTTSVRRAHGRGRRRCYLQEACPIYQDKRFWCSVGLLQFLAKCNTLQQEQVLDSTAIRGPRVAAEEFVLEGINKCRPEVEWRQWQRHSSTEQLDLLSAPVFRVSKSFRSLVAHSNLLPISFRRRCLLADVRCQLNRDHGLPLVLRVDREPAALVEGVTEAFKEPAPDAAGEGGGEGQPKACFEARLLRPLIVVFGGEAGQGPGVRREFFQVAIRAFLAALFVPTGNRTYWFAEIERPKAFFACGVLLGQAVLHDVLIPNLFPWTLFDLLLRDMRSPHASSKLGLPHLAAVSQEEANSLQKVLNYEGEDILKVFGDLGWERTGSLEGSQLSQSTKESFIAAYVQWKLTEYIEAQFKPFSSGFQAVVGGSVMVRQMVDAAHLERIVCGGEVPVDVAMLRKRSLQQGWAEEDKGYLETFWAIIEELSEQLKRLFLVFVTASDRVPLRGWEELRLTLQKDGSGDERLPTAYTCFCLLLLPRFSSTDVLRKNVLQAIQNSEGFGLN